MTPNVPWWKNPELFNGIGDLGAAIMRRRQQNKPASQPMNEPGPDYGDNSVADYAADGQVVTEPTLVVIGEDQPEAVVPLSHRHTAKVRPSLAGNYYGE